MTFYLKYRPQSIDELDLEKVRLQLNQALSAKSIPHAFLFSGSRGLGKTSAARIIAKALNCKSRQETRDKKQDNENLSPVTCHLSQIEPCNTCDICLSITKGSSPDVIEIDGASNRGIDDIRSLRETVALSPLQLKKKVYIIDEVHMLTKEAFNALLKTLEEPPSHVIFILATTEPHKVPETIISRCLYIQFDRASEKELLRSLHRVVAGENLKVEESVLKSIINRSHGGFRDSVKLLEQLAYNSDIITQAAFDSIFGQDEAEVFINLLIQREGSKALEWMTSQEQRGVDWTEIIRNILTKLRLQLINKITNINEDNKTINKEEIIEMINLCMQAAERQKTTLIDTLPLELVVAKWIGEERLKFKSQKSKLETQNEKTEVVKFNSNDNNQKIVGNIENKKSEPTIIVDSKESKIEQSDNENSKNKNITNHSLTLEEIKAKWQELLNVIRTQNRSLESILRSASLAKLEDDILTITVYYGLHKQQLESDKYLRIVESSLNDIFGIKPHLNYVLGDKKDKDILDSAKDQELEKNVEEVFG